MAGNITYKGLYQYVVEEIDKRGKFKTSAEYKKYLDRTSVSPIQDTGRSSASTQELIQAIQLMLDQTIPQYIAEGLNVTATDPISDKVNISAGHGSVGGKLYTLENDISNFVIPFDDFTYIYYLVLYKNMILVERTYSPDKLTIAKIIVPQPGKTLYIRDDKDDSWDAYIVNFKEYKLFTKLELTNIKGIKH